MPSDLGIRPLKTIAQYTKLNNSFPATLSSDKDLFFVVYATAATSDFYILARPNVDPKQLARTLETAINGTVLEKETIYYMGKDNYSWADIYVDHSIPWSRKSEMRHPVGAVLAGLEKAGYRPHTLLCVMKSARATPPINLAGVDIRKWTIYNVDSNRTDLDFNLSAQISVSKLLLMPILIFWPFVISIIAIPVLIRIADSHRSTPSGRKSFFVLMYSLLILFLNTANLIPISSFLVVHSAYPLMDIWFGSSHVAPYIVAAILIAIPAVFPVIFLITGIVVAKRVYKSSATETDPSQPHKIGLGWLMFIAFLIFVFVSILVKHLLPSGSLFVEDSPLYLIGLIVLLGYVYNQTTQNITHLHGKETPDDTLMEHLSDIATGIGVKLKQVCLVEPDLNDKSHAEAVLRGDGTLLVRSHINATSTIDIKVAEVNDNVESAIQQQIRYNQQDIDFICAREMAQVVLKHRPKSLAILYIASLLAIIPGVVFVFQSSSLLPIDWKFCLSMAGLVLLVIDFVTLSKNREIRADQLALSVTGNYDIARKVIMHNFFAGGTALNAKQVLCHPDLFYRITKRLRWLEKTEAPAKVASAENEEIESRLSARVKDIASRIGVKACSVKIKRFEMDIPGYYWVLTRHGEIKINKAIVDNFTVDETNFVLARELAKTKFHQTIRPFLLLPVIAVTMITCPTILTNHNLILSGYITASGILLMAYTVWAVFFITRKPEMDADRDALLATNNLDAAISAITKLTRDNSVRITKEIEENIMFPDTTSRIKALHKQAAKHRISNPGFGR